MSSLQLAYYGDDFTGSTDVLEVLESTGIHTMLFLDVPSAEQLASHPDIQAVGVAGISRTMSPERMDAELVPILEAIKQLGAPLVHYKICSTFDSSPSIGSIGRAAELLMRVFPRRPIPIVVGVPQLGRYVAFGNLFAAFRGVIHRLDQHPALRVHPVTPMTEAALKLVLESQTTAAVEVLTAPELDDVDRRLDDAMDLVLVDVADTPQQLKVGSALRRLASRATTSSPQVVIGSSGVEYALAMADRAPTASFSAAFKPKPTPTLAVVGSRAPNSAAQTKHAIESGFVEVRVDPVELITVSGVGSAAARRVARALETGRHVIVHVGPDVRPVDGTELARALGRLSRDIVHRTHVGRMVVAGGDSSGLVARAIGIEGLRMAMPLTPGAPLCIAFSSDPDVDGLEICLKGGQIGNSDYLEIIAMLGEGEEFTPPLERTDK